MTERIGDSCIDFTSLSVFVDMAPYVHEVLTEYQDAENEDREPRIPPMPRLWPAFKNGLYLALRQAAVTFVRWIFDWGVSVHCSTSTALRLLTEQITGGRSSKYLLTCPG
ncbi:unnamed protein product [Ostreobium quekettii]|uniref:Uncharacterized protein n=1 Tax=Ostreobium quekettii TaxID=121088 RepID=A0A8S1JDH9_9CHLO|nr:unnamed protein product [Ostreobium quekettii]|eukprot:evm.model.scf_2345.4 EVM.evm.TU.scf_2345.4   scf_2345:13765-16023(-)